MSRLLTTALCLGYAALVLPEAAGQRVEHTLLGTYSELCTWGRDAYGLSEDHGARLVASSSPESTARGFDSTASLWRAEA
jgi:hypothetical protein